MTKHRLMLSAATAALLVAPVLPGSARADTTVTTATKTALSTKTDGNILIDTTGSIVIKNAGPVVTLNSNNSVVNNGSISNVDTASALGVSIDTSGGDIVAPSAGFSNAGGIDLSGTGTGKTGLLISGGHSYFGNINFNTVLVADSTGQVTTTGSSVLVVGDSSTAVSLSQFTNVYGDMALGGPITLSNAKDSSATGGTLADLEGNLFGNFVVASGASFTNIGPGGRGIALLAPIAACDSAAMSAVGLSCGTGSTGAVAINGTVQVTGTQTPNIKGGNPEGGSVLVIGSSIAGGVLINGPKTANSQIASGVLSGNGPSSGTNTNPVLLIDPGQSVSAINLGLVTPIVIGPVQTVIDTADGISGQNGGYSLINHGVIAAQPMDTDVGATAMVIQGQSAANTTCLSGSSASCVTTVGGLPVGGLLNTGTITAQAVSKENTTSSVIANALTIGGYATVPRIVVSSESTAGTSVTPGSIQAAVSGPGGGSAAAIAIAQFATVPEIDVLQHASITATVATSSPSPTADFANSKTPFQEFASAIVDQSGTLTAINNAGTISAINTPLTPGTGAIATNTQQAINLLANTLGGVTINNSGNIQGDVFFGAAGGNDTLNVGNTASGSANPATGLTNTPFAYASVSGRILGTSTGLPPTAESNTISFGTGSNQTLHVGSFGYVNSVILAQAGALNVTVDPNGQLFVANTAVSGPLFAKNFDVNGGVLGLSISQGTSSSTPVVQASNEATLSPSARIGVQFGTFFSSGTSAQSVVHPTLQTITLISAPAGSLNVSSSTLSNDNSLLAQAIPFLFESPGESGSAAPQPLSLGSSGGNQTLLLSFLPRSPGLTNADGTAGLGLSGDAYNLFPFTAQALANDPTLGAAIASSLSVTNGAGNPTLNIAASQLKAQQVFSQFTPDVSGGSKQIAILLTDQATGPVAARQRLLRNYANQAGELTLWGEEFGAMISNKGKVDAGGTLTAYKDHGWGFTLGGDAGSARGGWYGGALTYYSGDVSETSPRASIVHEQWYLFTGYTDWRGRHVFVDTAFNIGYGSLDGNRTLVVGDQSREAVGKRAALLGSLGGKTGVLLNYGGLQFVPNISLDAMSMREEGYSEASGGDGLNLQVAPYYANSLRVFVGNDFRSQFNIFGVDLIPEVRLGYRYDFVSTPVKLRAGFISTGGLSVPGNALTFVGPDPDTGNILAGASFSASTDTWSLGVHYDWLRGNNASTTQVGMLTLLGRI